MAQNNNQTYEQVKDDLSQVAREASAAAENKYSKVKEKGRALMENAEEKAYQFGAKTRELIDDAEGKLKQGISSLESQVRSHPIISITGAMLVGGLLVKIFSRTRQ